jgi:hypothetical protein
LEHYYYQKEQHANRVRPTIYTKKASFLSWLLYACGTFGYSGNGSKEPSSRIVKIEKYSPSH